MCHHRGHHHWAKHAKHRKAHWKRKFMHQRFGGAWGFPPVNIQELDDRYELWVFAAGFTKEEFEVKVKDQILVIKAKKQESEIVDEPGMKRKEFDPRRGFKRVFELNEKIDKDNISASYEEGVLKLTLPKLEGFETFRKDIDIV